MHPVNDAFEPLLGLPSWQTVRVHGSIIKMDFGVPRLVVGDPREGPVHIDGALERAMKRSAHVQGDWALTITYCEWSVLAKGAPLAHCESSDTTIARALGVLNGQALSSVKVDPATAATTFTFDLGCVLATHPAPAGSYDDDGPEEQWILAQPNGMYLAVRADGTYSQQKGDSQDGPQWYPLPA